MIGNRLVPCFVLTILVLLTGTPGSAEDFVESWYMSRGRSNMEIENYKAAIEAFEKVVERNPANREAMRSLGIAYDKQGLKDKAIEQFDRYLARWDDEPDIAFAQALALEWSRYAYREKDMLKYYRMGLKRKNDPQMRLKYASHLAGNKDTSHEAVEQYLKVLELQPRSPDAHRGLAKSYAWLGQNDLALYHANLARTHAKQEPVDLTALRQDISKGREPAVEGVMGFLAQPERPFELYGFRLGTRGKLDATPFTTTNIEAGVEHFWNSSENRAGGYLSAGNRLRLNPTNRIDAMLEYHSAPRGDGLAFKVEYAYDGPSFSIRPGFKREFRYDSFAALIGSQSSGQLIGLARSNQFYSDFEFDFGALHTTVTPFVGWVTAERIGTNEQVGLNAKTSLPLWKKDNWDISGEYLFYVTHYGENHGGFQPRSQEPLAGGYFSPQVFVNQIPRLAAVYSTESSELSLSAGPALQYVDEATRSAAFRVGGDAHAALTKQLSKPWMLKIMADYTHIASVYMRMQVTGLLVYTFY